MDDEGDRPAHLSLVRSLLSDDLLAQHQARLTDVHSVWANGQIRHLSLVLPTERAPQPSLFLWSESATAQDRDTFITDRHSSGSGNQALHLVLLFAAKGAHQHGLPLLLEDLDDVRPHLLQAETEAFQHACAYALSLPEQSQEEVFGAEKVMVEVPRFVNGKLHYFLRTRGLAYFARHEVISTANNVLDGLARLFEIDPQAREHLSGDTFPLAEQAQQEVLGADVVVLETLRLFLGKLHDVAGSLGEPVEAPLLVPSSVSPFPTGTSTLAGTPQPSAERSSQSLHYHPLILSVSMFSSPDQRQLVLSGLYACPTNPLNAFDQGGFAPPSAPWRPAVSCQFVQAATGGPTT